MHERRRRRLFPRRFARSSNLTQLFVLAVVVGVRARERLGKAVQSCCRPAGCRRTGQRRRPRQRWERGCSAAAGASNGRVTSGMQPLLAARTLFS